LIPLVDISFMVNLERFEIRGTGTFVAEMVRRRTHSTACTREARGNSLFYLVTCRAGNRGVFPNSVDNLK
jgi:hypothetical protein